MKAEKFNGEVFFLRLHLLRIESRVGNSVARAVAFVQGAHLLCSLCRLPFQWEELCLLESRHESLWGCGFQHIADLTSQREYRLDMEKRNEDIKGILKTTPVL